MKFLLVFILTSQALAVKVHRSQRFQGRSNEPRSLIEHFLNLVEYYGAEYGPSADELREHPEEAREYDIGEKEKLVEGDMIITEEQDQMTHDPLSTRKAISGRKYLWPQGRVPYAIDPSSEGDREVIQQAIQMWEKNTCLTFPSVAHGSKGPHIFFAKKNGCTSHVGRVADTHPNGQQISIGPGCATPGIVAHEIGHAIGFYHEQSRTDRDEYIIVVEENIIERHKSNFDIRTNTDNQEVPYDLKSVMHYGPTAFSKNGKNTIVTRDPYSQFEIGQRRELSFYDIQLANKLYNCAGQCSSQIVCYNEGFVDKNCRCRCSPNFRGRRCEYFQASGSECKFNMRRSGTFTSPNYPSNYPKDSRCIWRIQAPRRWMRVRLTFEDFDLRPRVGNDTACRSDRVEVRTDDVYNGNMYCDKDLRGKTLTSRGSEMWVFFFSGHDNNKGFSANIDFINDFK